MRTVLKTQLAAERIGERGEPIDDDHRHPDESRLDGRRAGGDHAEGGGAHQRVGLPRQRLHPEAVEGAGEEPAVEAGSDGETELQLGALRGQETQGSRERRQVVGDSPACARDPLWETAKNAQ